MKADSIMQDKSHQNGEIEFVTKRMGESKLLVFPIRNNDIIYKKMAIHHISISGKHMAVECTGNDCILCQVAKEEEQEIGKTMGYLATHSNEIPDALDKRDELMKSSTVGRAIKFYECLVSEVKISAEGNLLDSHIKVMILNEANRYQLAGGVVQSWLRRTTRRKHMTCKLTVPDLKDRIYSAINADITIVNDTGKWYSSVSKQLRHTKRYEKRLGKSHVMTAETKEAVIEQSRAMIDKIVNWRKMESAQT
jgi:hypothetical protein